MLPEKASPDDFAPIRTAFDVLKRGSVAAASALVDIAVNGKSEMARMYAAQAVLDRVGLPAKVDVGVTAVHLNGGYIDAGPGQGALTVAERLRMLREQALDAGDAEIITFPGMLEAEAEAEAEAEVETDE